MTAVTRQERQRFPLAGWFLYWNCPSGRISWVKVEEVLVSRGIRVVSASGRRFVEDVLQYFKERADVDLVWRVVREDTKSGTVWKFYSGRVKIREEELRLAACNFIVDEERNVRIERLPNGLEEKFKGILDELRDTESGGWLSWQIVRYILDGLSAIRVRRDGGLYFVPVKKEKELVVLEGAMRELGFEVFKIGVVDEDATRDLIWSILSEEVAEYEKEVREYIGKIQGGGRFKKSGFDSKFEVGQKLREKLKSYRMYGEEALVKLTEILEGLERELFDMRLRYAAEEISN